MNRSGSSALIVVLLAATAALAGCATVIDPTGTVPVDGTSSLVLSAPFTYAWQLGGMCSPRIEYTLAPGTYVSAFRNGGGTFYSGPADALETRVLANDCDSSTIGRGLKIPAGIYLPANPHEPARIYYRQPRHGIYDTTVTSLASGVSDEGASVGQMPPINMAVAKAPPMAAGAGAGIGAGIVGAAIGAEYGTIRILAGQKDDALQRAIGRP